MRDYQRELEKRTSWIRDILRRAGAAGIVYGNSGGKDSTLTGILCRHACENTLGLILPCQAARNYREDRIDALAAAKQFGIRTAEVDLTEVREALVHALEPAARLEGLSAANLAPRLRMAALYAAAQSLGCLVAGTGNRSEAYVGYFTKWGDGACDFNPIADLTVTEIYEFLRFLKAPAAILEKAPSAGLYEGQTDESEMGLRYEELDQYLLYGRGEPREVERIRRRHEATGHKRRQPLAYGGESA